MTTDRCPSCGSDHPADRYGSEDDTACLVYAHPWHDQPTNSCPECASADPAVRRPYRRVQDNPAVFKCEPTWECDDLWHDGYRRPIPPHSTKADPLPGHMKDAR